MSTAIPVILCGAMKEVAALIKENMLPEYNVVYAGHNLEAAEREVPFIVSGHPPPVSTLHTQLSSNDFTIPPYAVITGGGYSEESFRALYEACSKACGSEENVSVLFFRTSNELTDRLAAEGKGPAHSSSNYPLAITQRLKEKLREVGIAPGAQIDRSENKDRSFYF